MDLIDKLNQLASKIVKQKSMILTEEATKTAFIMPFIAALGYDGFDAAEVIPEYTADIGIKKGEKVDYAIKSMLSGIVDLQRVVYRDALSYFGILLDDNNRKPICRLRFNSEKKYLEVFNSEKNGEKFLVTGIDDLYQYKDKIISSVQTYLS